MRCGCHRRSQMNHGVVFQGWNLLSVTLTLTLTLSMTLTWISLTFDSGRCPFVLSLTCRSGLKSFVLCLKFHFVPKSFVPCLKVLTEMKSFVLCLTFRSDLKSSVVFLSPLHQKNQFSLHDQNLPPSSVSQNPSVWCVQIHNLSRILTPFSASFS